MTLAEVLLWKQLSRRKMRGYDFDRQMLIGRFIVDFYCNELCLAIEERPASNGDYPPRPAAALGTGVHSRKVR